MDAPIAAALPWFAGKNCSQLFRSSSHSPKGTVSWQGGNKLGAGAFIHDRFTVLHSQCCTPSPVGMIVTLAPGSAAFFAHATMWPLTGSADTLLMPQTTWIFERASERIVFTRHKFVGCTVLIVVAPDGITRSKSFRQPEDAIAYQQHLESALTTDGWVLEAVTAPDGPTPVIWYEEAR